MTSMDDETRRQVRNELSELVKFSAEGISLKDLTTMYEDRFPKRGIRANETRALYRLIIGAPGAVSLELRDKTYYAKPKVIENVSTSRADKKAEQSTPAKQKESSDENGRRRMRVNSDFLNRLVGSNLRANNRATSVIERGARIRLASLSSNEQIETAADNFRPLQNQSNGTKTATENFKQPLQNHTNGADAMLQNFPVPFKNIHKLPTIKRGSEYANQENGVSYLNTVTGKKVENGHKAKEPLGPQGICRRYSSSEIFMEKAKECGAMNAMPLEEFLKLYLSNEQLRELDIELPL